MAKGPSKNPDSAKRQAPDEAAHARRKKPLEELKKEMREARDWDEKEFKKIVKKFGV